MELDWAGKAVSIECEQRLGIFQGIIKDISAEEITIVRAFRNGVPLRKQDAEVTLKSTDILKISLIPSYNGQSTLTSTVINKPTPVKLPGFNPSNTESSSNSAPMSSNGVVQLNGVVQREQKQKQRPAKDNAMSMAKKLSNMKIENCSALTLQYTEQQQQVTLNPNMTGGGAKSSPPASCSNSVAQFFGNLIPPKVEVRMGSAFSVCSSSNAAALSPAIAGPTSLLNMCTDALADANSAAMSASKPIDIIGGGGQSNGYNGYNMRSSFNGNGSNGGNGNGHMRSRNNGGGGNGGSGGQNSMNGFSNGGNGNGNGGGGGGKNARQQRKLRRENSMRQQNRAFATSVDDPLLNEDFDFEGNLALFDKQAIWNVIESGGDGPAESMQPAVEKKYRHDEHVLEREPPQLRGIEAIFHGSTDFVTDDGLIIPTIPHFVRSKIEITADRNGLKFQRQNDMLARGASEVAITILGGARRLTPKNHHQWPKIAIICEKSANFISANIGATTGRQLASHGIEVVLYLEDNSSVEQTNNEISLFKATGNSIVYSVDDLPTTPDLVILSTNTAQLSVEVTKWLAENRASIFAIDPPTSGLRDIAIKCAILPILPLNGISAANNCGKLYLCNLGIPEKFFRDAGVKYKSPFGHKFVIPIHPKH